MAALSKLFSYSDKLLHAFFLQVMPEILKLLILAIIVIWKQYRLIKSSYNYRSAINRNSSKFSYRKRTNSADNLGSECSICLSEFAEGEDVRELQDCKHCFHGGCLEKWLMKEHAPATCPLCRLSVVPPVILAEYQKMQMEKGDDVIEKELALVLLNALDNKICCNGLG